mgnify:CR=1 FL=1
MVDLTRAPATAVEVAVVYPANVAKRHVARVLDLGLPARPTESIEILPDQLIPCERDHRVLGRQNGEDWLRVLLGLDQVVITGKRRRMKDGTLDSGIGCGGV